MNLFILINIYSSAAWCNWNVDDGTLMRVLAAELAGLLLTRDDCCHFSIHLWPQIQLMTEIKPSFEAVEWI